MPSFSSRLLHGLHHLAAFEWLLLALLFPIVHLPVNSLLWGVLLLPLPWLTRWFSAAPSPIRTPLDLPLAVLAVLLALSLLFSVDPAWSLPKTAAAAYGIALFYGGVNWVGEDAGRLRHLLGLLLALGIPIALLEVAKRLPGGGALGSVNSNEVAGVLLWVAPLALGMALGERRSWQVATAALLAGAILFTGSRSGLLGWLASVALVSALHVQGKWRWAVAGTAVVGLGVAALFFDLAADGSPFSLSGRVEIWSRALHILGDFPFTGIGLNTFRRLVPIAYPLFTISNNVDIAHAHNIWLDAGVGLGLPGLVAYTAVWLGAAVMAGASCRRAAGWSKGAAVGLVGCLGGYAVYGLTDAVALGGRPGFIFWLLLAAVAALHRQTKSGR